MLRIIELPAPNHSTTLQLDGRLVGQWVELLRSSCEQGLQDNDQLTVDLQGVSFADQQGVQLLRYLETQRITLLNRSPFLLELMKQSERIAGQ